MTTKQINEAAEKYISESYIDFGDLTLQAESRIYYAVIFGATFALSKMETEMVEFAEWTQTEGWNLEENNVWVNIDFNRISGHDLLTLFRNREGK